MFMDLFKVFLATLGAIVVLFFLSKLMGNKQITKMNMFDYINGITIGSIAAEMATSLETDVLKPLLAMILFGVVTYIISVVTNKSIVARRLITGKSIVLLDKDKLYRNNFSKVKMNLTEFLEELRSQGYFSIDDVELVVFEPSGKLSILPKSQKRPCTTGDLSLAVPKDRPEINVILDGKILQKNLKFSGNNIEWLNKKLKANKLLTEEVFLAIVNDDNEITFYKNQDYKNKNDIFQ